MVALLRIGVVACLIGWMFAWFVVFVVWCCSCALLRRAKQERGCTKADRDDKEQRWITSPAKSIAPFGGRTSDRVVAPFPTLRPPSPPVRPPLPSPVIVLRRFPCSWMWYARVCSSFWAVLCCAVLCCAACRSQTPLAAAMHSYRGDIVNGLAFTESSRRNDPYRMLSAYHQSAQVSAINIAIAAVSAGTACACLPACLLACLPACLLACLPACPLARLPACPLARLPACLLACLPSCLLACLPACLLACVLACLRGCLAACRLAGLPACVRACLLGYLFEFSPFAYLLAYAYSLALR